MPDIQIFDNILIFYKYYVNKRIPGKGGMVGILYKGRYLVPKGRFFRVF